MAASQMRNNIRVAVEGCGHGTLDAIYASVAESCKRNGWSDVDILIIGGDFQAVRNAADLNCMAVPVKYREIGDFHKYYSGEKKAPYLTLFVGGNHEASNHLRELYYGGWVAPNIYFMGAANVLRLGNLRIAGMSGIWKGYNYKKPHFERLPFNEDDIRSIYHVRELDARKLLQLRTQVDVGISHDWPRGVEWMGDWQELFKKKAHLRPDAESGNLGNVAAKLVLDHLKPPYWFSAHLHVKYAAIIDHAASNPSASSDHQKTLPDLSSTNGGAGVHNEEEIDLDVDDDDDVPASETDPGTTVSAISTSNSNAEDISAELRAELPAAFQKAQPQPAEPDPPTSITNTSTKFLALDKCLPYTDFLQLLEIPNNTSLAGSESPLKLEYDPEWLAITRAFALNEPLVLNDQNARLPADKGRAHYARLIDESRAWIDEALTSKHKLGVPENFEITTPVHDFSSSVNPRDMPREYNNPQTQTFCDLLGIPNVFLADEQEIQARVDAGVPANGDSGGNRGGGSGGYRGGGRGWHRGGRGRGRGGRQSRGMGRGRGWGRGS